MNEYEATILDLRRSNETLMTELAQMRVDRDEWRYVASQLFNTKCDETAVDEYEEKLLGMLWR